MPKKKKQYSFEEELKKLEEISEKLDSGQEPFEDLIKHFEEGMEIAKGLREKLEKTELKINQITDSTMNNQVVAEEKDELF